MAEEVNGNKRGMAARQAWREQQRLAIEKRLAQDPDFLARRRLNLIKWVLGLTGLGMLLFTGLTMITLIVAPMWYRSLPTSEQVVWANRIPFLHAFAPTRVYNADRLPTTAPDEVDQAAALALLASPAVSLPAPNLTDPGSALAVGGDQFNMAGGEVQTDGVPLQPPATDNTAAIVPAPTQANTSAPALPAATNAPPGTPALATVTPVLAPLLASPTPPPTFGPQPTATATPTLPPPPTPTDIPVPSSWQATGYRYVQQQWNTCGPANLTQALNYMGWNGRQSQIIDALRPNREDRNVSPWEMVSYVNDNVNVQQGAPIKALMRVGGTLDLVKRLVSNNFSVILEKGYNLREEGWLGHYLTIQGYDDSRREMHGLDTYLGDRWESYDELDRRWQMFNRLFIVLYPADREQDLANVLGPHRDVTYSIQYALSTATEEASSAPDNPYAWFNLGSSYTMLRDYKRAVSAFDQAFNVGGGLPPRMLWYQFTPYEAYYQAGDYAQVLSLTQATLGTSNDLEESHYWRGMALAAQGDLDAAARSFERALLINPTYRPAEERLAEVRAGAFRAPQG
ncbi:MAG: tetratricopeptide repeat protein [Anaerolineae bacterium]|nr:tetratricopeptide repeat protein [Anaerolineae bacterium]